MLSGRLFDAQYCDKFNGELENCVHTDDCGLRSIWGAIELVVGSALKRMTLASLVNTEEGVRESLMTAMRDTFQVRKAEDSVSSLPGVKTN